MTTPFKLEHTFKTIPIEKFVAHLNDPKLNKMLEEGLSFDERTLTSRKETPEGIEWQFKVRKSGELPASIKKIIKGESFGWQETSRLVRKENCIYWEIRPLTSLIKFFGEGTWKLSPAKQGCTRVIEGKVTVEIPLIGKLVEGFIVNELVKGYETEPSIQEQFYAQL